MAKAKFTRKTSEERKQEIQELSEKVLAEIQEYSTSPESLLEYADFISRFHSYSINNTMLIQHQFQGAVAVASFKDWKDKGYSVNKGEKGIQILSYAPITLFKDAEGNTKQISEATKEEKRLIKEGKIPTRKVNNFKKGHVFDISQTNAPIEDLPKIFPNRQYNFSIAEGNNAAHLLKGIEAVANELNIEIKDMRESSFGYAELGRAKGAYVQDVTGVKQEIILNSRNTPTQNLATAIHELAHAKMHHMDSEYRNLNKPTIEFQAELTSYIVCKHYGMDTSEKAIPYIADWTKNGEKLEDKQKALEGVHKTAAEFMDIIDPVISRERELEQGPISYHDHLLQIQENNGGSSETLDLENTEFWRTLEKHNPEDFQSYLTYRPLYEQETQGDLSFEEPMMYIHGVSREFQPFGEVNNYDLEPYKYAETIYTVAYPENGEIQAFSGTYESDQYVHPLHYMTQTGLQDPDTVKMLEDQWQQYLEKEQMPDTEKFPAMYPRNPEEVQMPAPVLDTENEYYFYDGFSQPVKLGTVSDIVTAAEKQESIGRFVLDQEIMRNFFESQHENKEEFNQHMERFGILKNPVLEDLKQVNERMGFERNENLTGIDLPDEKHINHVRLAVHRAMER
ncbi:ArdC-like ssDNA-binding domain-containing protein [Fictibacillus enclensis]|uniref:ArdC-like ssDNA-binding domain-containing protein n=1 Tax=Fictibacillus enclensis TaxID=1017270 RepID=UPI0025A2A85A|nr:ArdC-like ssDNA-binding domain-containing protein [Fictibacillus enclensis]MDM5335770.1 ArdC-like ssDNA-binding domain-containing protein [Fictibacillus enclensis]